jgi:hypothetical protein
VPWSSLHGDSVPGIKTRGLGKNGSPHFFWKNFPAKKKIPEDVPKIISGKFLRKKK